MKTTKDNHPNAARPATAISRLHPAPSLRTPGKRFLFGLLAGGLAAMWLAPGALWFRNNSLGFRSGLLSSVNDPFLDNSGHILQSCSWHHGNALRTRGETYGGRIGRVYVAVQISHVNPKVSAREDD